MSPKRSSFPCCGKRFTPWRAKQFCSEPCKRKARNRPRQGQNNPEGYTGSGRPKNLKKNPRKTKPPRGLVR